MSNHESALESQTYSIGDPEPLHEDATEDEKRRWCAEAHRHATEMLDCLKGIELCGQDFWFEFSLFMIL